MVAVLETPEIRIRSVSNGKTLHREKKRETAAPDSDPRELPNASNDSKTPQPKNETKP